MRKFFSLPVILVGGLLLMLVLLLAAFSIVQGTPEFTDASAPGWSRGKLIGHASLVNPVALLPDPQGGVHLVWVTGDQSSNQQLNYAHVNANGDVVSSQPLALPQSRPESPTLVRADDGTLHLFYLSQSPSLGPLQRALHYARLSSSGQLVSAQELSGVAVKSFQVVQARGLFEVLSSGDDAAPGLSHICIDRDGKVQSYRCGQYGIHLFDLPSATRVSAAADSAQHLHVAWFQRPASCSTTSDFTSAKSITMPRSGAPSVSTTSPCSVISST